MHGVHSDGSEFNFLSSESQAQSLYAKVYAIERKPTK